MRPHLHLLLPSSTAEVALEVRLYLPATKGEACPVHFSKAPNSDPVPSSNQLKKWLESCSGERLVTACHPWGKLGGSCLDPVIAGHLVNAVYPSDDADAESCPMTALLTWNVRGVGRSQGSMGLSGLNNQTNERDLEALEDWAMGCFPNMKDYRRFGYSWGSWTALSPSRPGVLQPSSIFLVSPPVSLFGLLALPLIFNRNYSFRAYLDSYFSSSFPSAAEGRTVIIAYGTSDEFTSRSSYVALEEAYRSKARGRLKIHELEGAGHFYRAPEHGDWLTRTIKEWLQGQWTCSHSHRWIYRGKKGNGRPE